MTAIAVGDMLHDREIVADEDVGEAEPLLQILQQIEHLAADRDVERRDRLVADDQLRIDRQRAGNGDALALAAGELVRVALGVRGLEADQRQQLGDAFAPLGGRERRVQQQRLGSVSPTVMRGLSEA